MIYLVVQQGSDIILYTLNLNIISEKHLFFFNYNPMQLMRFDSSRDPKETMKSDAFVCRI